MAIQIDLPTIKRNVNLVSFAANHGYEIDRLRSTKKSIAMRSGNDKVVISKKGGVWVYFSVFDEQDSGTTIDFVARRLNKTVKEAVLFLADWTGIEAVPSKSHRIEESSFDPDRVKAVFARCRPIEENDYLKGRGLGREMLTSQRFAGRVFLDRYSNLAFPHFRNREVSALELKNAKRGLLVKGSQKTFWRSNTKNSDRIVVVTESVIDAMSYQKLINCTDAMYLATGGGMSVAQCKLLIELLESSSQIEKVLVATDHDQGGDRIADRLLEAIQQSSFSGESSRKRPDVEGEDWNDALCRTLNAGE